MSNIAVRKDNGNKPVTVPVPEQRWEPLKLWRDFMGWDPFREMTPFLAQAPGGFLPSFEVKETKEGYQFTADLPGVKESDIDVTVTGNRLTVSGKREEEKRAQTDTYYTYERTYGDFSRSFTLPDGVDMNSVRADVQRGVLTLSIQKKPEAQTKKISVGSTPTKA